jgi:hypothetical protein
MIETQDALLLVSAVDVTIGVDLQKLGDRDIEIGADGGVTRICLPAPEIFLIAPRRGATERGARVPPAA